MEFYTHIIVAIALDISRHNEIAVINSEIGVANIRLHQQMAFGIIATCSTYHINKSLIVGVLHSQILGFGLTPVVLNVYFISSGKGYTVVVIGKLAGYIQPKQS